MTMKALLLVLAAAACNIVTVFCLRPSKGMSMSVPWPTLGVIISILLCHWFLAQAVASGGQLGFAIAGNVVVVMVAAGVIGWVWHGEKLSAWQLLGYALAVGGVVLAHRG
jgi:multidrug transporter EmrE-like cation transporter